jgi:hypothetical protein
LPEQLRICFAGPMLGGRGGWVPNPAEELARHFEAEGVECRLVSQHTNRVVRLFDTLVQLPRWRTSVDVVVVMTYSGAAFAVGLATVVVARLLRLPVVLHLHGGNLPDLARRRPRLVCLLFALGKSVFAHWVFIWVWLS